MGEEAVVAGDEGFGFFLGDAVFVSAAAVLWWSRVGLRLLLLSGGSCGGQGQEWQKEQQVHGCGVEGS